MRCPVGTDSSDILCATCSSCGRDRSAKSDRLDRRSTSCCWLSATSRVPLEAVVPFTGRPQAFGEGLDQVERQRRVALEEGEQVPRGERQAAGVGVGLDAGHARMLVDDGKLAEEIAFLEVGELLAAAYHARAA